MLLGGRVRNFTSHGLLCSVVGVAVVVVAVGLDSHRCGGELSENAQTDVLSNRFGEELSENALTDVLKAWLQLSKLETEYMKSLHFPKLPPESSKELSNEQEPEP